MHRTVPWTSAGTHGPDSAPYETQEDIMDVKTLRANLQGCPDDAEVRVDHEHGYSDADIIDVVPMRDGGELFVSVTVR